MAFDWREYYRLATILVSGLAGLDPEAAQRSAVSRAYYAAFCHARNYARDRQGFVPVGDARDHERVRRHYRGRGGTPEVARRLDRLRQARNLCDYDDTIPNLPILVTDAVSNAQAVLAQLI